MSDNGTMDLSGWRKRIDELDKEILRLLNQRAEAAMEIGRIKEKTAAAIYEPDREKMILANLNAANTGPLTDDDLALIYSRIIQIMRDLQRRI